ncbi:TPA: hypothetical protein HH295_21045 [Xanthomonas vasicola pv. zeae]|uniref:hypothetical protein n=1 Tax=Xanthomonas vasicola TaxID=56459 RepID=UPI000F73F8BE|nr:hypothetical protein [Xanthomonas vasicola]MBV7305002.1 hypothetical protein [Xanthomonas vasicola pv. vasculorum]MDO6936355.1 hypothetical protein [Xanthomonas vasicola]MDO6940301.1 hypothetical protein [Xanthomonas vasicola]MDO6957963.1 hypothetical protein [Xanthomonas vasicola]MDO6974975.1 hypothetical protein [Xanthomonas vasicola]
MNNPIIILSAAYDYHATAVKWALEGRGHDVVLWDGFAEEKSGHANYALDGISSSLILGEQRFDTFASAWFRRRSPYRSLRDAHPSSISFMKNELSSSHEALGLTIEQRSQYVVGGSSSRNASSKILQLETARFCGLNVPDTLISNDFHQVSSFASRYERILVKHFLPHYWGDTSNGQIRAVAPSVINDISKINRRSIEICPAIYQVFLDKAYEIRVTVIGDRIFSARIQSRKGGAFLDWRQEYSNSDLAMSAMILDASTESSIRHLMSVLNLRYGCLDFAVDNQGRLIFLEVNPGGQFLFVEDFVPELRLLDAFTSMLAYGSPSYPLDSSDAVTDAAFMESEDYFKWHNSRPPGRESDRFVTLL